MPSIIAHAQKRARLKTISVHPLYLRHPWKVWTMDAAGAAADLVTRWSQGGGPKQIWQIGSRCVFRGMAPAPPDGITVSLRSVAGDLITTVPHAELRQMWRSHAVEERLLQLGGHRVLSPEGLEFPAFSGVPCRLEQVPCFWDMVSPHTELTCVRFATPVRQPTVLPPAPPLDEIRLRWGEEDFTWGGIYRAADLGTYGTIWTVRYAHECMGGYARFIVEGDTVLALSLKSCRVCRIPRALMESYAILRRACADGLFPLDPRDRTLLLPTLLGAAVLSRETDSLQECREAMAKDSAAEQEIFYALLEGHRSLAWVDAAVDRTPEKLRELVHQCGRLLARASLEVMSEAELARERDRILFTARRLRAGKDPTSPCEQLLAALMGFGHIPANKRKREVDC